ncbi:two-component system response regulator [Paenibacillus polymyxa]|uniref:response regulator n=1 Tax=Paenibacillus polymyxa TaxID=1406 RepID=UPI0008FC4D84|nr:response regulator [Paenibacillus polymyxa]APB71704.1 two-component system response regulator [Paenibacillus polymyxa]
MGFKVLLIDDEPWALEGMQICIDWGEMGFEVCGICGNGMDGLRLMEELSPDLVMVDIHMPIMDGLEMIKEWRQRGNVTTKFIILTGYSEFDYARKALKYRVSRYLLKPLDEEQTELEIRAIQRELLEEQELIYISQIARREEVLQMIKEVLLGKSMSMEGNDFMESVSQSADLWNVCLVQAHRDQSARLGEFALELLDDLETAYLVHLSMEHFVIVFGDSAYPGDGVSAEKTIEALARRLAGFRVFMAVGAPVGSLTGIGTAYKTASKALLHAFYELENNGIIHYDMIKDSVFQHCYNQVELLERILETFEIIDYAGYRSIVDSMEQVFWDTRVYPDEVQKFVVFILHEIRAYMSVHFTNDSEPSDYLFDIPNMDEALLTFDDMIGILRSCGQVCFELLLKQSMIEPQGIVQDINDYIRIYFRESLTIKQLAEQFFLHPTYLGQLLIRKNGIGFNELLHDLRIEEASRLLRMNQYKNSELSEMVGYTNYNHFLKQFEKRLGMSPNEYKKIKAFQVKSFNSNIVSDQI